MKTAHILTFLISLILVISCGICKHNLPPTTDTTTTHVIDSIAWHDSTLYHHVYKEYYNDYTDLLDTLNLSTSYSEFSAWVDTTSNKLKGKAENKDVNIPIQIKWKEKIQYRDSIHVVKEPYPVEVVKEVKTHFGYEKILWVLSLLAGIMIGRKIYPIIKKWLL